ncbi:hypothetical protein PIN31009_01627 [Pandoraea iniqua]|uniref:hypothetical protein n=1 Tax=Pandoraea iniqua TaxID=2508288 RepID=UPI00124178EB|nr:hypothetical protein [Pandoraea iniqua]VVD91013.1 hypothetical protein PIN31009_01627 [Pandoraea iniqua]
MPHQVAIRTEAARNERKCCSWNGARGASFARTHEQVAHRSSRQADIADSLVRTSNCMRELGPDVLSTRRAMRRELTDAFMRAWAGLWVTTGPCQHFYRKEFDLAHERDVRLATQLEHIETTLTGPMHTEAGVKYEPVQDPFDAVAGDIATWLRAMSNTGDRGWHFRVARDLLSLLGNVSLLAIIGERFYRDAAQASISPEPVGGPWPGAAAANTPFDIPWADWTLLSVEGLKGLITQSLGSPTLIRHHAVDEVLKRMDAGCRLLAACLPDDLPGRAGVAASPYSSWRDALGTLTRLRDVATVFTLANSAVPPARLILWVSSWLGPQTHGLDSDRGVLRVAGLVLDSCRAVTSLAGTWARNVAFAHDARQLRDRWQVLGDAVGRVPEAELAMVMRHVARVMKISIHCDTALLAKIASDKGLCEFLLDHPDPLTVNAIAQSCERYGVQSHPSITGNLSFLSLRPAESSWGKRWRDEGWQWSSATSVRAAYRLLLAYQHYGAMLPEWLMARGPCGGERVAPAFDACRLGAGSNSASAATVCVDIDDIVDIDVHETRL